jgi:predicted peptidase
MKPSKWQAALGMLAGVAIVWALTGADLNLASAATPAAASAPAPVAEGEYDTATLKDQAGKELPYRLMKPANYDAKKKYPLVIFLHGVGECGTDNAKQLCNGAKALATAAMRTKYPCFELVPQCPPKSFWGADMLKMVVDVVGKLGKDYSIDENRIYITGLSMGGYGTWSLIQDHPEYFAAAAPVCGGGNPAKIKGIVAAKLPIWVWHGAADPTVNVKNSQDMVKALKDAGLEVKYTETPGQGHNEWDVAYASDEFWAWLFAQKKAKA